jgi:hypothetical protein
MLTALLTLLSSAPRLPVSLSPSACRDGDSIANFERYVNLPEQKSEGEHHHAVQMKAAKIRQRVTTKKER